nr:MAG TPA: hypothetical protein [Caudoviricetes sp.]
MFLVLHKKYSKDGERWRRKGRKLLILNPRRMIWEPIRP